MNQLLFLCRFVACQHALVVLGDDGKSACEPGDSFWQTIVPLAHDHVIGVRIGVARLVGDIYGMNVSPSHSVQ